MNPIGLLSTTTCVAAFALCALPAAIARPEPPQAKSMPIALTGRLLVIPHHTDHFAAAGMPLEAARIRRWQAIDRIRSLGEKRVPELDLWVVHAQDTHHDLADQLRRTGDYRLIEPDWLLQTCGTPNDPYYDRQWHLRRIRCDTIWPFTVGGSVICAFVDTGVDRSHPDLASNLVPGYNAVRRVSQASGAPVDDLNGHGTATAGIAAATGNNSVGGVGVGWTLSIMPVRVSDSANGSAFMSDIIDGIVWAVRNRARVVSVGYAGVQASVVQSTGEWVRRNNALLVWPMDNAGVEYSFDWPDVIVVSGTQMSGELNSGSSFGVGVDFAAPATGIYAPSRGGFYTFYSGNSFAGPQVAGVAALAWSMDPSLSPFQILRALELSAEDIGTPGRDNTTGFGIVDAAGAVRLASRVDFNRDGFIDFFDYDAFINAFESGSDLADVNADNFVDYMDYSNFVALFVGFDR